MGFTGQLVVAHSDVPLEQIPLLAAIEGPHAPEAAVDPHWLTNSGWQAVEITGVDWDHARLKPLLELTQWTGAPASDAWVLDSDCAIVTGLVPDGRPWRTALHIDTIVRYADSNPGAVWCPEGMDPGEYGNHLCAHVPHAAVDLVAWAKACGFVPASPGKVEELLGTRSVFVEETWDRVLTALGFPTS